MQVRTTRIKIERHYDVRHVETIEERVEHLQRIRDHKITAPDLLRLSAGHFSPAYRAESKAATGRVRILRTPSAGPDFSGQYRHIQAPG